MRGAPLELELLDFASVKRSARISASVQRRPIPESEIAYFSNPAFWRFRREATVRHAEDLARRNAIRFVARILCCIEAAIGIELPIFTSDPREHTAFDVRRSRRRSTYVSRRRSDQTAADIADDSDSGRG